MGKVVRKDSTGISLTVSDLSNTLELQLYRGDLEFVMNGRRLTTLKTIMSNVFNNKFDSIILNGLDKDGNSIEIPISYSQSEGTVELGYPNEVVGQLFQELWFEGKCVGTCRNGHPAQFVDSQGGHILVKEANMSEVAQFPESFMGVFTFTQTNGNFVKMTWFGNVNDISTKDWETQSSSRILYLDTEGVGSGGFSTLSPSPGYRKIKAAAIVKYSTGSSENGRIVVRPTFGTLMADIEDVDGDTATMVDNDVFLKKDFTSNLWKKITWATISSYIKDILTYLKAGTLTNYTKISEFGIELVGTATQWDDLDFPLIVKATGAGKPTLTTITGNIKAYTWAIGDSLDIDSTELAHRFKPETNTAKFHVHIVTNGSDTTDRFIRFNFEYVQANFSGVMTGTTVGNIDLLIPANTPDRTHLIYNIGDYTTLRIGSQIVGWFTRVAATGTAPTNNPFVLKLQCHAEVDSLGSKDIVTK